MPKTHRAWTVLGNDPIQKLEENLWHVEGAIPDFSLKRKMVVVKLGDGSLLVHNGICLREEDQKEVEAWGPIRWIVVPNGFHRLDAHAYKTRYPEAKLIAPRRVRKAVEKVVAVDGTFEDGPRDAVLAIEPLDGSKIGEAAFVVRHGERVTLVFNDTVFNQPHLPGFSGFVYRMLGSTGAPKVTTVLKLFGVENRAALRAHLGRLAETKGLARVIPGHGTVVEGEDAARKMLRAVAATV